ncbi:hypothetical protein [Streptomyces sp. NPDC005533]|uniref:hypothetical protein n=1 Tax=Streptomyces sp. NPDC005533 TaxID=3364723 RepID=UPI0036BFDE6F
MSVTKAGAPATVSTGDTASGTPGATTGNDTIRAGYGTGTCTTDAGDIRISCPWRAGHVRHGTARRAEQGVGAPRARPRIRPAASGSSPPRAGGR